MANPNLREVNVGVGATYDIEVFVGIGSLTQATAELWGLLEDGTYTSRIGVITDNNGKIVVRRSEYPVLNALHLHFTAINDFNDATKRMNLSGRLRQQNVWVSNSSAVFRDKFAATIETRGILWRFT